MLLQISNLQSGTLIKSETLAQVFFCEFCEIYKNKFFIEQLRVTASIALTLLKYNFQFVVHFSPTFVNF